MSESSEGAIRKTPKTALPCKFCGSRPQVIEWEPTAEYDAEYINQEGGPSGAAGVEWEFMCSNFDCGIQPGVTGPVPQGLLIRWNREYGRRV